ncbi:MAG: hypothetical protein JST54_29805 [Deltaproteobacteria bacterium]|nr:hypothetical protein [Deltaproteobacteria bacterium]
MSTLLATPLKQVRVLIVLPPEARALGEALRESLSSRARVVLALRSERPDAARALDMELDQADFAVLLASSPSCAGLELFDIGLAVGKLGAEQTMIVWSDDAERRASPMLRELPHLVTQGGQADAGQLALSISERIAERFKWLELDAIERVRRGLSSEQAQLARVHRQVLSLEDVLPADFMLQPTSPQRLCYWTHRGPHRSVRLVFDDVRGAHQALPPELLTHAAVRCVPEHTSDGRRMFRFTFFDPDTEAVALTFLARDLDVLETGLT